MKNSDTTIGFITIAFSVIGLLYVRSIGFKSTVGLSPAAFPQFIFVALGLCGLVLLFGSLSNENVEKAKFQLKKVFPILTVFTIFVFAFQYFGFLISAIVFLATAMHLFKEKRVGYLIIFPIITTVGIYILFSKLFLIPLP